MQWCTSLSHQTFYLRLKLKLICLFTVIHHDPMYCKENVKTCGRLGRRSVTIVLCQQAMNTKFSHHMAFLVISTQLTFGLFARLCGSTTIASCWKINNVVNASTFLFMMLFLFFVYSTKLNLNIASMQILENIRFLKKNKKTNRKK